MRACGTFTNPFSSLHMIYFCSAQVAVIKEHFSQYSVISSVVLEDQEHTENEGLRHSENCSVRVTFSARHFAERAYQNGKCWKGTIYSSSG